MSEAAGKPAGKAAVKAAAWAGAALPAAPALVKVPLWLLALFTFSGTLAMHIFVPALPYAATGLNASIAAVQLTISLYIAGLAVGQLIYGPLADRYGRRPILMAGLSLYSAAGLAAAFAPGIEALIAARLLQALGGCAGLVLGRTMVRDTALPEDAARRLALMNLMVTIGPGLAPLLGSALAATLGWRSIFYALSALGLAMLGLSWRLLPETGAAAHRANADARTLGRNYLSLLKSPVFLGYALGGGCATTSMYAYVAAAPFIFVHSLGRPAHEVGIYLALLVAGIWTGSVLVSRLIRRMHLQRLMVFGNGLSVLAAGALMAAVLLGHLGVAWVVGCMFVFTLGAGLASPAALTQAISVDPRVTGSASGLYGFTQMAVGAACTALVGLGRDPLLAAAIVLLGACVLAQASFWWAARSARRADRAAAPRSA
ncbi:MAG: multidrug effflux MFS transporter [Burkholderiaceae bacterium]